MGITTQGLEVYIPLYSTDSQGSPFTSKDVNAHACTVTGAVWGSTGRTFDGADDFIDVACTATVKTNTTGTIEMWVKITDPRGSYGQFIGFKQNTETTNNFFSFFYEQTTGLIGASLYTSSYQWYFRTNAAVSLTTWYHLALTVSGTGILFYINNSLTAVTFSVGSAASTEWLDDIAPDSCLVGKRRYNAGDINFYKGIIGEVLIYNRALTLAELVANDTTRQTYLTCWDFFTWG